MAAGAPHLALLLAATLLLAGGAAAYGSCSEAYCVSCPTSPNVCKECKGQPVASWAEPLGVYAAPDGKCRLCVDRDQHCTACNGRTGACTFCGPNYGVGRRGRCEACASPQCASCGPDARKCLWCRTGYGVDVPTGKCVPCKDPGCEPSACGIDASKCIQCKAGWQLKSGSAVAGNCVLQTAKRGRKNLL